MFIRFSFKQDNIKKAGNSSEPHIHFQIQDGKRFYSSAGLPIQFSDIITFTENASYKLYDIRPIPINNETSFKDNDVRLTYIQRAQTVKNEKRMV